MIYPPAPLWVPPTPTLILPGRRLEATSSKRMLLLTADGPYRPSPPSVVQVAAAHNTAAVFGSNTTIGNLLIGMAGRRQADPGAPTDGGTWTALGVAWSNHNVENDTVRIYGRIVTAATTTYGWAPGGSSPIVNISMVEVAGASLTGVSLYAAPNNGGPATALDIGDLGTLGPERLAFGIWVNTADLVNQTVTPGVWTRIAYGNRDDFTTASDSLTSFGGFPFVWSGRTQGAGVDVHGRIDIDVAKNWSGLVAVLA